LKKPIDIYRKICIIIVDTDKSVNLTPEGVNLGGYKMNNESEKIKNARDICRARRLKYKITTCGGVNRLYLFSAITRHYIPVCYEILNLSTDQLKDVIDRTAKIYYCIGR